MAGSTANPASAPAQRRQLSLARYLRDSRIELKKVSWPTREQTINLTVVVCVVCVAIALFLGGLDWVFATFIKLLAGS